MNTLVSRKINMYLFLLLIFISLNFRPNRGTLKESRKTFSSPATISPVTTIFSCLDYWDSKEEIAQLLPLCLYGLFLTKHRRDTLTPLLKILSLRVKTTPNCPAWSDPHHFPGLISYQLPFTLFQQHSYSLTGHTGSCIKALVYSLLPLPETLCS